jgi:hypothetical protein
MSGVKRILSVRAGRDARVDSSLVELASLNPAAVAGFAANMPPSAAKDLAGSDEFGAAFGNIKQVYGSADATGATGTLNVTLRSETNEQAQALAEKLGSLKQLASFYFSRTTSQSTVNSSVQLGTTITAEGNDVKLRLEEPLADLSPSFAWR